jgi:putative phosphoribosyl transferase
MRIADVVENQNVVIEASGAKLGGEITVPENARSVVVFAHGSGSSRFSPRNIMVANYFNQMGLATLLFDLLTEDESIVDEQTRQYRFDIDLLAKRLVDAVDFVKMHPGLKDFKVGTFGASTGAAAALIAAAERPEAVGAVVSRGGRADLAGDALDRVEAPTLLIVGALDSVVIDLNRQAAESLHCHSQLTIVPGATHLFSEPGKLEQVAGIASEWFVHYLGGSA